MALAAIALQAPASASAPCFRYGDIVTLTGRYAPLLAPPDDGIVRADRNDAARRADVLALSESFCVAADNLSIAIPAALSIQIRCPAVKSASGATISLTGRLLGAHTGNGHIPVILACQTAAVAPIRANAANRANNDASRPGRQAGCCDQTA